MGAGGGTSRLDTHSDPCDNGDDSSIQGDRGKEPNDTEHDSSVFVHRRGDSASSSSSAASSCSRVSSSSRDARKADNEHLLSLKSGNAVKDMYPKIDGGPHLIIEDVTDVPDDSDEEARRKGDEMSSSSAKSEATRRESPVSSPPLPLSDLTHDSLLQIPMPAGDQSPQAQVMDRSQGYEPDRIPASVFCTNKSISPLEWSVASNESLFSIHVGNTSFSRDHIIGLGGDLTRSGELMKSGEFIMFSPVVPASATAAEDSSRINHVRAIDVGGEAKNDSDLATHTLDDQEERKMPPPPPLQMSWNSPSLSFHSNDSGTSTRSFAFPILTGGTKNGNAAVDFDKEPGQASVKARSRSNRTSKWFPCCSFFSCSSCFSCSSSCCSCSSCFSCSSCSSCFSCSSCSSCFSSSSCFTFRHRHCLCFG